MKLKYLSVVLLTTFITLPAVSQVRLGQSSIAEKGAVLDLSSTYVGGMKLPNVDISDLGKIPVGFSETTVQNQDVNANLAGMIVYNTNTTTGVGVYFWDGDNWRRLSSGDGMLTGTPNDWVDNNSAIGDGTSSSFYINNCPTANVTITAKAGYTLANVYNGTISGNTATFATTGNAWLSVLKDGKLGIVYIKVANCGCKVKISPTEYIELNCYNLGADVTADWRTPSKALNGHYYQWGKTDPIATVDTPDSPLPGWTPPPSWYQDAPMWTDSQPDPCPEGWRLPTENEWQNIYNNNSFVKVGTFAGDGNFTSGYNIIPNGEQTVAAYLPAAGLRDYDYVSPGQGFLTGRGGAAAYWTDTQAGTVSAVTMFFNGTTILPHNFNHKAYGFPVRCVAK